ncbi:transposase family protein, partial [Escherichia coli]|uniref:transposase family protein n=1 Tax=Escherichia coli TaxID=562 RepID=UPI001FCE30B2
MSIQSLLDYISVTPDIRQQGKVKHKLSAILFLTVCAVIAGADEWQEIEDFGHERLEWLGNDSNLLIVFYVQIMPDDFVMQLHR